MRNRFGVGVVGAELNEGETLGKLETGKIKITEKTKYKNHKKIKTQILTKSLCCVNISHKAAKLNTTCKPWANYLSIFFPASVSSLKELVFRLVHLSLPAAICPDNEVQLLGLLS